jgi:hypothetical protein
MTISSSTIYTDVFSTMRTCLVAAAPYVTDDVGTTVPASVVTKYNNARQTTPQVVLESSTKDEDTFKFQGVDGRQEISMTVECYNLNSKGTEQLAQQVERAVKSYDFGMDLIGISSDVAFINPNEGNYHMKGVTFTFQRE